ncbi:Retrovirus-related Pol polyprotein from type-1 retrotransposable element R1 [Eumeta japonica]|uniref:Retrovirus-related Pol polyprotein from type-1 retrotransposable element R1 n=1 Tax=Eumeta variegata TaxID=151549 RepID=A0A4C1T064_EUMVA|nr:Retrovirus-related Pol polyprotein from type-1 retrotransposable element R1 [Eumeta japonica]
MAEAQTKHFQIMRSPETGNSGMTLDADDVDRTIEVMLEAFLPRDDPSLNSEYHRQVKSMALMAPFGKLASSVCRGHLGNIIRVQTLPNTSPGLDGISVRIAKEVWKAVAAKMTEVYRKCVLEGVFPDIWKTKRLVLLSKINDRPPTDPKAYQPLMLLAFLGNVLEKGFYKYIQDDDILFYVFMANSWQPGRIESALEISQGSVVGPALWNLLLDDLFRLPLSEGCRFIAYADDVTAW